MLSTRNNRAVAIGGYTASGVYAVGSVANAVNGFPLASIVCGCASALIGAVTNEATNKQVVITDADVA
jgi:hypothetical protein